MKLDPDIHMDMHSVLFLKPDVTCGLAANCRPVSFDQFGLWAQALLPNYHQFNMVGLSRTYLLGPLENKKLSLF